MFHNHRKNALAITMTALLGSSNVYSEIEVNISYLQQEIDQGPVLSNILPEPEDAGLQGAKLAIQDSNTTGRFLKHKYQLQELVDEDPEVLLSKAKAQYDAGIRYFVVNTDDQTISKFTETLGKDALIFNAGSTTNALRQHMCTPNLFHTIPSRAMLTDALAQWLKAKRLQKIFMITGATPEDKAYSNSFKRSVKRFGLSIVEEKDWSFDTDLRRTAQSEMPLFTQHRDYDVVFVADERGDFGEYVLYNTWLPRPVVGTQGLMPVAWHRVVEQYGAAQLQSRFEKSSGRWMNGKDYSAWAAVRTVAEAVTRTQTNDASTNEAYIKSDQFQLAGFKGRKLDFRSWNGQLRQTIPLVHPRSLVSLSPQEGFLHPTNELDTLGFDQKETDCTETRK